MNDETDSAPDASSPDAAGSGRQSPQFPLTTMVERARQAGSAGSALSRIFRRCFRGNGALEKATVEAFAALEGQSQELADRLRELRAVTEAQAQQLDALTSSVYRRFEETGVAERGFSESAAEHTEQIRQLIEGKLGADGHLGQLQGHADQINGLVRELHETTQGQAREVQSLREMLAELRERQRSDHVFTKGELSRYGLVLERRDAPSPSDAQESPASVVPTEWAAHRLDSHYLSFEDRFRGSRAEIKERVRGYLAHIRAAGAGTAERPVLDVGCGRGEWLDLLRENGLEAAGVDSNEAMVRQCRELHLSITQGDALDYLRSLADDSLGAVTAFHIIEHLPFEFLISFIAESRRVLRPGGIAIFESPNCKNLLVGASRFYMDPTHRNPIYPETAAFLLESQGFEEVQLEYHSPVDVSFLPGSEEIRSTILRELLFGSQDFAVIGRKPAAPAGN